MIGLVATLAPTIGPTVGGYLSNAFSWHWLFLVNVVPGICVAIAGLDCWSTSTSPNRSLLKRFDWWGLPSMARVPRLAGIRAGGGPAQRLAATTARSRRSRRRLVAGAIVFFWRALTAAQPIVDLRAFRDRNFAFGSLFSFVMGIGLYGLTYLYPVYLGQVRGYDALMIGETMFVTGVAMFLTAPISGLLSQKMDPRIMMLVGFMRLRPRHLHCVRHHGGLGFLRAVGAADPARLLADAVHGADQQSRARHADAGAAEERVWVCST